MLTWSKFRLIKITLHKMLLGQSTLGKDFINIFIKIIN